MSGMENVYSGLLDNPPSHLKHRMEIITLVKHCSKNLMYRNRSSKTSQADVMEVYTKLKSLLQESV